MKAVSSTMLDIVYILNSCPKKSRRLESRRIYVDRDALSHIFRLSVICGFTFGTYSCPGELLIRLIVIICILEQDDDLSDSSETIFQRVNPHASFVSFINATNLYVHSNHVFTRKWAVVWTTFLSPLNIPDPLREIIVCLKEIPSCDCWYD